MSDSGFPQPDRSQPADERLRGGDEDAITSTPMSGEQVRRKAAIGAMLVGGRSVALRVVGFLANIVLARLLTPKDFGIIAFGVTLTNAAGYLADAGIGAGLVRGPNDVRRGDLKALLAFQLLAAVVAGVVVTAVGATTGRGPIIGLMVLSLPIAAFRAPGAILQERELAYRTIATVELVEHGSYYVWAVVSVALGAGVWGLSSAIVVRALAGTLAMQLLVPAGRIRPHFDWPRVRRLIGFGARFQGVGVASLARDLGLNAGTASVGGMSTLGLWSFAFALLQAPFLVFEALWRVSYPTMARLLALGEDPGPVLQRAVATIAIVSGLLIAGFVGTAPALVPSVFGPQWDAAVAVLPWAGAGLVVSGPISVVSVGYLFAKGRATAVLVAVTVAAVLWLGIGLGLMSTYGVSSLGMGHLAGAIAESLLLAAGVRRLTNVRFVRSLAPSTCAAFAAAIAGWTVAHLQGENLPAVVASGLVVVATYTLVLLFLDRRAVRDSSERIRRLLARAG